jgi:hexosaminidase
VIDRLVVPAPSSVVLAGRPVRLGGAPRFRLAAGDGPESAIVGELAALGIARTGAVDAAVRVELGGPPDLGDDGYRLETDGDRVALQAHRPGGLYRGVQTLRQLLPGGARSGELPGLEITDRPRFGWRGLMLDVARHFFGVADVKRVIDLAALYRLNVLHLHLTDDQGWRIAVDGWPNLTEIGGRTAVGGGPGGYYTKADYTEIVEYAAERFVTVVPEIDVPGHTNAALVAYPELNCDGRARPAFTGVEVGFSSLCLDKPVTQQFLEDVFAAVAAMTPGEYVHVGGDEAHTLTAEEYAPFVERVLKTVVAAGKVPVGWQEVATARLAPGTIVQYWNINAGPAQAVAAVRGGAQVILSPADRVYLDMKYDAASTLGLDWAGHVEVRDAYDWDPGTLVEGIGEADILGVEAALWTETVTTVEEIERMLLPRLAAIAEVAWSPPATRDWPGFRARLAAQVPHWRRLGVAYHRSPQVVWP